MGNAEQTSAVSVDFSFTSFKNWPLNKGIWKKQIEIAVPTNSFLYG